MIHISDDQLMRMMVERTKYATLGDLLIWDYSEGNTASPAGIPVGVVAFSFKDHDGWCAIDRDGAIIESDKWVTF